MKEMLITEEQLAVVHESGHAIIQMAAAKKFGLKHGIISINTHIKKGNVTYIELFPGFTPENIDLVHGEVIKKINYKPQDIDTLSGVIALIRIKPMLGGLCANLIFFEKSIGKTFTKQEIRKIFDDSYNQSINSKSGDIAESMKWMDVINKHSPKNEYTLFEIFMETVEDIRNNWQLVMKLYIFLQQRTATDPKKSKAFLDQLFKEISK